MKLEIQYQGSIKTLFFGNSYKNLSNLASGDDKTNTNRLVKVVCSDILN